MDFCAVLLFEEMMIAIWLDEVLFWKWFKNELKLTEGMD
jgi:hypothetical protein